MGSAKTPTAGHRNGAAVVGALTVVVVVDVMFVSSVVVQGC